MSSDSVGFLSLWALFQGWGSPIDTEHDPQRGWCPKIGLSYDLYEQTVFLLGFVFLFGLLYCFVLIVLF